MRMVADSDHRDKARPSAQARGRPGGRSGRRYGGRTRPVEADPVGTAVRLADLLADVEVDRITGPLDVAVREVLADLDVVDVLADRARDADAEQHAAGAAPSHEPVADRLGVAGKQCLAVGPGREQDLAVRVELPDGAGGAHHLDGVTDGAQKDLVEPDGIPRLCLELLHPETLTCGNAVLLASGLDNCVHDCLA